LDVAVFPTCVGVNRTMASPITQRLCIPHVCGGEPRADRIYCSKEWYSPRVWG